MKFKILFLIMSTILLITTPVMAKSFTIFNSSDEGQSYFSINGTTGYVGLGTENPLSIFQIPNNEWISARNAADTGIVNMFKLNSNNQIEVGGPLNIGSFEFSEDSGLVSFVDMPVSSAASQGTAEGYVFKIDGDNLMTVYSESDGAGGIQNKRIGIGTTSPSYKLDVAGDINGYDIKVNGTSLTAGSLGAVTGSGTSGYLSRWNGTTSLNNSPVYTDGTNVGIGTDSPDSGLHVAGTSSTSAKIIIERNGDTSGPSLEFQEAGTKSWAIKQDAASQNVQALDFQNAAGTEVMTILQGGNVGIGTTSPGNTLDVNGGLIVSGTSGLGLGATGNTGKNRIQTGGSVGNGNQIFQFLGITDAYAGARMKELSIGATYGANNAPSNGMVVEGNVGIGTTSPGAKLEVNYSSGFGLNIQRANNDYPGMKFTEASGDVWEFTDQLNNFQFAFTPIGGSRTVHLAIREGGNVGIGTTSPQAKFHINTSSGGLRISESGSQSVELAVENSAGEFGQGAFNFVGSQINFREGPGEDLILKMDNGDANFTGNVTSQSDFCIEGGNCLSNVLSSYSETDPYWTANYTAYNSSWSSTYNETYNTWAYNQTIPAMTYADATFLRNDGDNGTGIYNFGGAWNDGGLTIKEGSLYAQSVWVYNISSLQVSNLNINGSLLPHDGFDNTFDVGSADLRWRDAYFGGDLYVNGTVFGTGGQPLVNGTGEANRVAFWTGENAISYNENLTWDATNNRLGIGTSSPSAPLEINNSGVAGSGSLEFDTSIYGGAITAKTGSSGSGILYLKSDTEDVRIQGSGGNPALTFYNSSGGQARISSYGSSYLMGGNLGIGTKSPSEKLEVQGNILLNNSQPNLIFYDSNMQIQRVTDDMRFRINGATSMTIDSNRNVGIGTTSPASKLHIYEGASGVVSYNQPAVATFENNGNSYINLYSPDASVGGVRFGSVSDTAGAYINWGYNQGGLIMATANSGDVIDFKTGDNSQAVRIDESGNVGIGTTSPTTKLTIANNGTYAFNQGLSFGDGDTGIYEGADDQITIKFPSETITFRNDLVWVETLYSWQLNNGASNLTNPVYRFYGDPNTGIGRADADVGSLIAGGQNIANWSTEGFNVSGSLYLNGEELSAGSLGAVTGSGTANYIPMWNGTTSLNNSPVYTDGTNVGIGTTSPVAKLDVRGDATADLVHIYGGGVRTHMFGSTSGNGAMYIRDASSNNDVVLNTNGNSYFNGGNVGIGTTAPSRLFHVNSSANNYIRLQATGADTYAGYEMTNDAQGWTTGVNSNDDYIISDGLQFGGDSIVTIQNGAPANMLYIKDTGNVGIGTTTPQSKLHLVKDYGAIRIEGTAGGNRYFDIGRSLSGVTSSAYLGFNAGENTSAGYQFMFGGIPAVTFKGNGNVGIGTDSPLSKLQVGDNSVSDQFLSFQTSNSNERGINYYLQDGTTIRGYMKWDTNEDLRLKGTSVAIDTLNKADAILIDDNGYVGIGTTNPDYKLDIYANTSNIGLRLNANGVPGMFLASEGSNEWAIASRASDSHNLYFSPNPSGTGGSNIAAAAKFTFTQSGELGINTTSPTHTLNVEGDINVSNSEIKMYMEGGALVIEG